MSKQQYTPLATAKLAAQLALSKKAYDIVIVDLRKIKNSFADMFVICSCDSDTQVRAVVDAVERGLKDAGMPPVHVEGEALGQWALIDCFDVVVHVFHRAARSYYNLERWGGDAKITRVTSEFDTIAEPKGAAKSEAVDLAEIEEESAEERLAAKPKAKRAAKPRAKSAATKTVKAKPRARKGGKDASAE